MEHTQHFSKNFLLICTGLLFILGYTKADCQPTNLLSARGDTSPWNESSWGTLEPSKDLRWVKCYEEVGDFECGRLQVPLNYSNPENGSAALALVRSVASVPTDSPDYLGPVLLNPGGPGLGGVKFVVEAISVLRAFLGPQYDLVGFDPRGIDHSTPRIEFYESREERALFHRPATELNHSLTNVEGYWAGTKFMGSLAAERDKDRKILAHMNTENSARDMLRITEAYGREKLQYWGFSYGSVIGYTFASIFPDKVERLLIDGIVDPDDYYRTNWITGTKDSAKTLQWFFESCKEAGPDSCAFYEDSVEAMENKLNGVYTSLIESPTPVHINRSHALVDYTMVRTALVNSLYAPFVWWRDLATALQDLTRGNATTMYKLMEPELSTFECDCDLGKYEFEHVQDGTMAYSCNDGDPAPPDLAAAQAHYRSLSELTLLGSIWASVRISCNGWSKDIPKSRFRGQIGGNTSFPMLIFSNTVDPATSLDAARNVSQHFPGSVLFTQDAPGHGSIGAPSACTRNAIRAYFVNGTLPDEGTVCPIDRSPFDGPATPTQASNQTVDSGESDEAVLVRRDDNLGILEHLRELGKKRILPGMPRLHV